MTTTTTLKMTRKTIIPPKTAEVVLLPAVLMAVSGVAHVADMVGQLQVEGYCVTTTPEKKKVESFVLL